MEDRDRRLHEPLENVIRSLTNNFGSIGQDRKITLAELSRFIEAKLKNKERVDLVFICTHNSRRSHISQVWAQAAAAYYGIPAIASYSGGTEATAFNPRAVKAMEKTGFRIEKSSEGDNPVYNVSYSDGHDPVVVFSKKYDAPSNPQRGFAAVMTCTHADEHCPIVSGMEKRIALPYDDPKNFDGTPQESEKYLERVNEIGKEILYAFAQINVH